jgi:ParE toxin of type II toxin-antitoxin system, parDE
VKAVLFHEAAKRELAYEALYCAAISPRLGERFIAAVEAATSLAAEFRSIGSPYKYQTRRVFPKKFRFSLVYVERGDELYVPAVAPFARKPDYWRNRRSEV